MLMMQHIDIMGANCETTQNTKGTYNKKQFNKDLIKYITHKPVITMVITTRYIHTD